MVSGAKQTIITARVPRLLLKSGRTLTASVPWAAPRGRFLVCHFPPGTNKWNKIEHRIFCHITRNWRGKPLISHEVIIQLIGATTTEKGLRIRAQLDTGSYPKGIKVSDQEMNALALERSDFHGEWNYLIKRGVALFILRRLLFPISQIDSRNPIYIV